MNSLKDIINLDLKITEPPEPEPPPAISAKAVVQAVNSETGEINPNFISLKSSLAGFSFQNK